MVIAAVNWVLWVTCVVVVVGLGWFAVVATLTLAVRMGIAFALDGADVRFQIIRCLELAERKREQSPLARLRAERPFSKHEKA